MSPLEFSIAVEAWRLDRDEAWKRTKALAWHIANLAGAAFGGKLPKFEAFTGITVHHGRQTPQQMASVLRGIKGGKAA